MQFVECCRESDSAEQREELLADNRAGLYEQLQRLED
jgi:hypothetical protein